MSTVAAIKPRKGDVVDLHIQDLAFGAKGVAKLDKFVIFVEKGIPGQHLQARIRRIRSGYAEAFIEQILSPSPDQVNPPCPYFGICGGCQLQHLQYEAQIRAKEKQVKELLSRVAFLKEIEVQPVIAAEILYEYRNN